MNNNTYAAKWEPDNMHTKCEVCKNKFNKLIRRKHHCRKCGKVVCDTCSTARDYVKGYKDKKVRICAMCNSENF